MTSLEELIRAFDCSATGATFFPTADRASWAALSRAAAGASSVLADRGVPPGAYIGISMESSVASVASLLGIWIHGCTAVSLPPPLRGSGGEVYRRRIGATLAQIDCDVVFGSPSLDMLLPESTTVIHLTPEVLTTRAAAAADREQPIPSPALVQFTSGSTGAPRGVLLSAVAIARNIDAIGTHLAVEPGMDSAVSWLPLHHDMGLVGFLLTPLAYRSDVSLMSPLSFLRSPRSWLKLISDTGATFTGAPEFAYRMLSKSSAHTSEALSLERLRVCLSGSERVTQSTIDAFMRSYEPFGFNPEALMPVYGLAEAVLAVTMPPLGRPPLVRDNGSVSLGRPLPGADIRAISVDGEGRGRIQIKSPWLFDGYLEDGLLRLRNSEWFDTNDAGAIIDGELVIYGRTDEVVILGGRNVFAEDIEAIAAETAQAVSVAAAFVVDEQFVLIVEVEPNEVDDVQRIAADIVRSTTVSLGSVVAEVVCCKPRTIPRTTSGKVQRGVARTQLLNDGIKSSRVVHRMKVAAARH